MKPVASTAPGAASGIRGPVAEARYRCRSSPVQAASRTTVSGIRQDLNVFTSFSCIKEAMLTPGVRVNYIPTTCGSPTPTRRRSYRHSHGHGDAW